MKKITFSILCLIFLYSCQQEEMPNLIRTDKEIIETAKDEYGGQFKSLSEYDNLYSNPFWEEATKFSNNPDTVSFYVPLINEVEVKKSYLIINSYDYKQTYFILRIPETYADMDAFVKDRPQIGVVRQDRNFLCFIGDVKEIIAKGVKVSCTGGEGSSAPQKPGKNDKCEYNSEDNPIELGEVIIPGNGSNGSSWWEDSRPPRPDETNPPGSTNVFPGSGSSGGGSNPGQNKPRTPIDYVKSDKDKFVKKNIALTTIKQLPNTCVTATCEYIYNKIYGKNVPEGQFITNYIKLSGETNYIRDGFNIKYLDKFTNQTFKTSSFDSFKAAVDNGYPIMTNIPSPIENSSHNIVVVGYSEQGLIYMDCEIGKMQVVDESYISGDYKVVITGVK